MGDDNDEDKVWATPRTIEFRKSDKEYSRDLMSSFSFQVVDLKHPFGEVLVKDIKPRHLVNNKASLEDTRLSSKLEIEKDKGVYVGVGGNMEAHDKGDPLEDVWMEMSCLWSYRQGN